ncbi:hypothetical protein [Klenkia brasiliensis]|uniref:Uncharacterized protein n=1 Tax=Klenkia brasiliensis TaxID=333142 RepID=A0A1G7YGG4_9ACTN|nr:hypothetical protein [Klenkia brasiliensis]SDG95355.1 hypothetical protein SAMN05660324_3942 [Klenkia brasiliensis]
MSDTGRDRNLIDDDVQANYRTVRTQRGWTWIELAEDFERQAEATVVPDRGYLRLAMWARAEAIDAGEVNGTAEREGTTPTPPGRSRPGKRTTKAQPAPQRTVEAPADASDEPADGAPVEADEVPAGVPVAV